MIDSLPASLSGKKLARAILDSASPESVAQTLPAQSIFFAIQERGLESSIELLDVISKSQMQFILDLDLWSRDRFNEERFWDWLALPDAAESLEVLQKTLKSIDLKLIALMLGQYVDVRVFEEATDTPPGPRFTTPDKGKTWILVKVEDGRKYFLLSRLLALIFETSAELFYQLLAIPNVATQSMLEEESYQERSKRLLAEGFPDEEQVVALHQPLPIESLKRHDATLRYGTDGPIVTPMLAIREASSTSLSLLIERYGSAEDFQSELTYITNAALLFFRIDISNRSEVVELVEGVSGILNLGLEVLQQRTNCDPFEAQGRYGLAPIYRIGLQQLFDLRKRSQVAIAHLKDDLKPEMLHLLELSARVLPRAAIYLSTAGTIDTSGALKLSTESRPFAHLAEIAGLERLIAELTVK